MTAGPQIRRIRAFNYRSIESWVEISVPTSGAPLVLIGENNAGKSNILRALLLVLGEFWPGSHQPEDHEVYGRSLEGVEVQIQVEVSGLVCGKYGTCKSVVDRIVWRFDKDADKPCEFTYESTPKCSHTYMSNEIRGQLAVMSVGVDRDLKWQLSYGSKWTALSKLMHRFHEKLVEDPTRVDKLKGIFADLVETFRQVEQFADFTSALKQATELFGGNLPYGLDIDFSAYDASNFFKSLRVFPHLDGEARTYDELGTGQEQVLAMAFTYAYAKAFGGDGLVLAVEEPESHLHPLAQQWVATKLREVAAAGVQVVVTTHSPYFIDLSRPGTTAIVRKAGEDAPTTVVQLKPQDLVDRLTKLGAPESVSADNVGAFYENSATIVHKAGLFARACVLVEGPTEEEALPELLHRLGVDVVRLGIAVIPVGGVTNIAKWVRYYIAHGIPVYPVFDTDSSKTGNDSVRALQARQDILGALRLDTALDWADYVTGPVGVHERFAVLDSNFETAMRAVFGSEYASLEANAREAVGEAKPLVARFAARSLAAPADDTSSSWNALRPLAKTITDLPTRDVSVSDQPG